MCFVIVVCVVSLVTILLSMCVLAAIYKLFNLKKSMLASLAFSLGGCRVVSSSDSALTDTAAFFGCDKEELRAALVSRVMQTSIGGRRGSAILLVYIIIIIRTHRVIQNNTMTSEFRCNL